MLDEWGQKDDRKRINGRECHGRRPVEAEYR